MTPARWIALLAAACLLAGCGRSPRPVVFHEEPPDVLSDWAVLVADHESLRLNGRVLAYELNTPLFSDYARKLRTVWMPEGRNARYSRDGDWEFPVGTVFTKTFYYPVIDADTVSTESPAGLFDGRALALDGVRLIETRLLVRQADGWEAYPYVWNAEQTEAQLKPVGALTALTLVGADGATRPFTYVVPDTNQCAGCHRPDHGSRELRPIGPKTRHLNVAAPTAAEGAVGQLAAWQAAGYLDAAPAVDSAPRLARWDRPDRHDVEARARAYLDINCGHCHNPEGAADTSGLFLDIGTSEPRRLGRCKPPIAAGRGSGDRRYSIVPGKPDSSILVYRMETSEPASAMPELGRSLVHTEGVALIREWIAGMDGDCPTVLAGQGDDESL